MIEAVFREEWGRAVSILTRDLGDLSFAEDAVQNAFAIALERDQVFARKAELLARLESLPAEEDDVSSIPDDRLALVFTCCHPRSPPRQSSCSQSRIVPAGTPSGSRRSSRARTGDVAPQPRPNQLQAAIGAFHVAARRPEETDWEQIAGLYKALTRSDASPNVALNRTVAVAMAEGPERGLELIDAIELPATTSRPRPAPISFAASTAGRKQPPPMPKRSRSR